MSEPIILAFKNITKLFPGVRALTDVSLEVKHGEVLAIMGENGAGKSTLMKIAAGLYQPDTGEIRVNDAMVTLSNPRKALALGIGMVPQELNLVPDMRVYENILLGLEPFGALGVVNTEAMKARARQLVMQLGEQIDINVPLKTLSIAHQQIIQIARALANQCRILIMDEPTAALSHREADALLENIHNLRNNGTTILYISHRIREVKSLADRVAILRDGQLITVQPCSEMTENDITQAMIGRPISSFMKRRESSSLTDRVVLEARGLTSRKHFRDISFVLHQGEILGFAGLVGAGRSEVINSIFGFEKLESGEILIDGQAVHIHSPVDAIQHGLGLVPEERKRQGLFLLLNVMENISIPFIRRFQGMVGLRMKQEHEQTTGLSHQLHVRTPSLKQPVRYLSGGNQQKVILARWLGSGVQILFLDEPTRGIDVNAKSEIHTLISEMAAQGKAVIVVSSEAQELMALADRIIVMREGKIVGEADPHVATEEDILRLAMWGTSSNEPLPVATIH